MLPVTRSGPSVPAAVVGASHAEIDLLPGNFADVIDVDRPVPLAHGESTWEEINLGVAGANYGWPGSEGPTA